MKSLGDADLARALIVSIELARETDDLRDWWRDHSHHIRSLPAAEKDRVIAAKDRRKEELT